METKRRILGNEIDIKKLVIVLGASYLAAVLGGFLTVDAVQNWYPTLEKPGFTPPNAVFGPVWTLLYTGMGVAAYLVWRKAEEAPKLALGFFGLQLVLNVGWNIAFFTSESPSAGLVAIALLWVAIGATIWKFYEVSKTAALIMIPYIAWVSFAGFLNYEIWRLN